MEHRNPQTPAAPLPKPQPDAEHRASSAQHELIRPDLPKRDVADGLEDFDGDEA